jgi:hypothetical protein
VIVTPNPAAASELLRRVRDERPERTEGIHLSGLLYCLRKEWHKGRNPSLWAEGGPYAEQDDLTLKFTLGETVHRVLGGGTDAVKTKIVDGIHYTPDDVVMATTLADGRKRIDEFKTTAYSANKSLQDTPQYLDQLGGYCAFEETLYGRLYVIHTRGFYNSKDPATGKPRGFDPVLRAYDIEFHPIELAGWRRELRRRKGLLEGASRLTDIPVEEHWSWECEPYCPLFGEVCEGGKGQRVGAFQHFVMGEVKEADDGRAA